MSGNGIGALVVTSADPVWRDAGSWIWRRPALFASAHVRVVTLPEVAP